MSLTNKRNYPDISSFTLHLIAMGLMLCDHLWATLLYQLDFLTWVGRLAFPVFAFMLVEGYFHTRNVKKYLGRLLFWAVLSEIPFNLMCGGNWFYPFHQNVLWTFLLGLACICLIEQQRRKEKPVLTVLAVFLWAMVFSVLALICMVDYFAFGIWTVLVFYLFRGRKWWCYLGQFLGIFWINCVLMGGLSVPVQLFGHEFLLAQQSIACFSLIPIWLYRGRQGPHNKAIQMGFYAFYPAHMLILALTALFR